MRAPRDGTHHLLLVTLLNGGGGGDVELEFDLISKSCLLFFPIHIFSLV